MVGLPIIPIPDRDYLASGDSRVQKIPFLTHIYSIGVDSERWTVCNRLLLTKQPAEYCGHLWNDSLKYCFQTPTWSSIAFHSVLLTEVFRQVDKNWVDMLDKIKLGDMSPEILNYLASLNRPLDLLDDGIKPTMLYTHKKKVKDINDAEFRQLTTQTYDFDAVDWGHSHKEDGSGAKDMTSSELDKHCKSSYSLTYYPSSKTLIKKSRFLLKPLHPQKILPQTQRTSNAAFKHIRSQPPRQRLPWHCRWFRPLWLRKTLRNCGNAC